jgi:hypothetical protein
VKDARLGKGSYEGLSEAGPPAGGRSRRKEEPFESRSGAPVRRKGSYEGPSEASPGGLGGLPPGKKAHTKAAVERSGRKAHTKARAERAERAWGSGGLPSRKEGSYEVTTRHRKHVVDQILPHEEGLARKVADDEHIQLVDWSTTSCQAK